MKKHDPSFSHLLLFRAFGAAFGVPISGFLPANVAGAARAGARRDPRESPQPGAIPGRPGISTVPVSQFLSGGLFVQKARTIFCISYTI